MYRNALCLDVVLSGRGGPWVYLCCEVSGGSKALTTDFVIDTGNPWTSISYELLEELEMTDFIEPCAEEGFKGTIKMNIFSDKLEPIAAEYLFFV